MNKRAIIAGALAAILSAAAFAVSTGFWVFGTQEEFLKGKSKGLSISSEGVLLPGFTIEKMDVEKEEAVWSLYPYGGGKFLVGTGSAGKIYIYEGDKVTPAWTTDSFAITCFASDGADLLLAGSMPKGIVFRLKKDGDKYTSEVFAKLPASYIWRMAYSPKDKVFFATTGPDGDLYKIDKDGAVTLWLDTKETNLLGLAVSPDGKVYVGSAPRGLIYEVTDKGKANVLFDCPEEEVWALSLDMSGLIAGANKTVEGAAAPEQKASDQGAQAPKEAEKPTSGSMPTHAPRSSSVYRVRLDGGGTKLFTSPKESTWDVATDATGKILVATGETGHIYRLAADGTSYETLVDTEQKSITAIGMMNGDVAVMGTSGPATVLKVSAKAESGEFTSPVLNAGFAASWGSITWRGTGKISVQARSGQTGEPDDTWSDWSAAITRPGEQVTPPRGKYFQFKVKLEGAASSLDEIRAAFLTDNQRPEVDELSVKRLPPKGENPPPPPEKKEGQSARVVDAWPKPRSSSLEVDWKAIDPDGDKLAYRLYYRFQNAHNWLVLNDDKPIYDNKFQWETEGLPEGDYALKIVANDNEANPPARALTAVKILDPVVIDNRPPRLENLHLEGTTLIGRAEDDTSIIKYLAVQIDGGEWHFVFSEDGMFDSKSEGIKVDLKQFTDGGEHIVAVRAVDAEDNVGAGSVVALIQ